MQPKAVLRNIKNNYLDSPGFMKIAGNVSWLLFDKIFRMGVGIVVGVWLARYLGPEKFGIWNYALAFSAIFGSFAALGLDSIVIKDLIHHPDQKNQILGSALFLKLLASLLMLLLATLASSFISGKGSLTTELVFLSGLGFVFQSVNVIDYYFQSQVESKYTVYAQNGAFFIISVVKIILILNRFELIAFAIAGIIEIILASVFIILAYQRRNLSICSWNYSHAIAKRLLWEGMPLILSGVAVLVNLKADQVLLGLMLSEKEVGIYAAAARISEIWYFIPVAIVSSLAKAILESKARDETLYKERLQSLFCFMLILSLLVAIITTFSGDFIIRFLYGQSYNAAVQILSLHIWAGIFICFGVASNCFFLAENLWDYKLYTTLIGAVVNLVLNYFLIPVFALKGAAIATVGSYFALAFSVFLFRKTRELGWIMLRSVNIFLIFYKGRRNASTA